jgi:ABC-type multidrug transport system ATPase subunit
MRTLVDRVSETAGTGRGMGVVAVSGVSRDFGSTTALSDVSLDVAAGEIHALLGPNGAGKTTLLRVLTGLVEPGDGEVRYLGTPARELGPRRVRKLFGYVPSGDRSFYLRISGLENLIFFGRLYGLGRSRASDRAWECLRAVGLEGAASKKAGLYSHGMRRRLAVARALLMNPPALFVDEATHDLDPEGAHRVRALISKAAEDGAAVIWATQRLDEIRGFSQRVTLLDRGQVRFSGAVSSMMALSTARRYVVRLRNGHSSSDVLKLASSALSEDAEIGMADDHHGDHYVLSLTDRAVLGDVLAALTASGIQVVTCTEERSGIETAFRHLTEGLG